MKESNDTIAVHLQKKNEDIVMIDDIFVTFYVFI